MEFKLSEIKKLSFIGKDICFTVNDKNFEQIIKKLNPCQIKGISSRLVYYWKQNKRPIPSRYLKEICRHTEIKSINIVSFSVNSGKKIIIPDKENLQFYYLLGLILGDGCLSFNNKHLHGGSYTLQITMRYQKEAKKVKNLIKDLFNINSSIYKGKGCYNICTFSKTLVIFLNKLFSIPLGKKYKLIKVPTIINKDSNYIRYFLKGLFDSDGNIYKNKNKWCIQIRQKSKIFIIQIHSLFKKIGIEIRGPYYDKANNSWLLWSNKKETVDNFMRHINTIEFLEPS